MKRSRKKALIITGIVLALPALFLVEEHFRGKWALAKLKRELAAKGEKLTIEECRPPLPPDEGDNAFPGLMRAVAVFPGGQASRVAPRAMRALAPGKAQTVAMLHAWPDLYASKNRPLTNNWETLASALALGAEQLPAIRELLRKPVFVSTVNYDRGFEVPLPHLAKVKMVAQEFSADALLRLHQGRKDEAFEDIIALLQLSDALRDERFVISQLVRIAIAAIAVGPTWQALQAPDLTDGQLARLQDAWRTRRFIPEMMAGLEMERAVGLVQHARFRSSPGSMADAMDAMTSWGGLTAAGNTTAPASFDDVVQSVGDKAGALLKRGMAAPIWVFAWSREDERAYIATIQAMLDGAKESLRSHSMQASFQAQAALEKQREEESGYTRMRHLLSGMMVDSLSRTIERAAAIEAQRDLVVAALALKRHELRHGRLPAEWAALVPEFLPAPPRDIFDGQPLRYRLRDEGGGLLLYSVGKDGKDDGGDGKPVSGKNFDMINGRDLVWPQPASAAEVEAADKKTNGAARTAPSVNK